MKLRPRLLLVCYANSAHALPWIGLLDSSEFEIRVFSSPFQKRKPQYNKLALSYISRCSARSQSIPKAEGIQPTPWQSSTCNLWISG